MQNCILLNTLRFAFCLNSRSLTTVHGQRELKISNTVTNTVCDAADSN